MGLSGNLSHFGVTDVFQLLASQQKTGVLRLTRPGAAAAFVLLAGEIVSTWDRAATPTDPLKTFILRKGSLPQHEVTKALRLESHSDLPFAQVLVREGMLDLSELARLVREQIGEELQRVLEWEDGQFEFTAELMVRSYGPTCSLRVEGLLLQAAHEADERVERAAEAAPPPEEDAKTHTPGRKSSPLPNAVVLVLLPLLALLVSYFIAPAGGRRGEEPIFGARVASFQAGREIRNLRLVLEMYRSLFDRYPTALTDLIDTGFLSPEQVTELRNHEIRYRALRGGSRYVLHSGSYGPLVQALPEEDRIPRADPPTPPLMGAPRPIPYER